MANQNLMKVKNREVKEPKTDRHGKRRIILKKHLNSFVAPLKTYTTVEPFKDVVVEDVELMSAIM